MWNDLQQNSDKELEANNDIDSADNIEQHHLAEEINERQKQQRILVRKEEDANQNNSLGELADKESKSCEEDEDKDDEDGQVLQEDQFMMRTPPLSEESKLYEGRAGEHLNFDGHNLNNNSRQNQNQNVNKMVLQLQH